VKIDGSSDGFHQLACGIIPVGGKTFFVSLSEKKKHPFAAQADIHHQPPKAAASLISYGP